MESQAQGGAQVVLDAPIFREAFERIAPEIEKVPESELLPINMETSAAVTMVLGRAPRLRALREEIVTTIPSFNIVRYDKVPDYAMAAWHAHTIFKNSQKPVGSLQDVAQVAERFRDLLYTDLQGLAKRGLVKNDRIKDLKPPNGYRATADDTFSIVDILRSNWTAISERTAVTLEELTEAEAAASRLINALGLRDGAPQVVAVTSLTRQRAHTLFVQAYDDARRVVMFLRAPYDDADEIAPSLYAGRGNGRRKPEEEASAPTTPATAAGNTAASATNGHADAHPATQVPAGMPGGSPFVNP